MAWFGPKGVASMLFALFVLKSRDEGGLIFDVAAITIIASIVAHMASPTPSAPAGGGASARTQGSTRPRLSEG